MKFGELIKREMKKKNMIANEVSRASGVDHGNLSRIVNLKTKEFPRIDTAIALFNALDIPLEKLREIDL